MTTLSDVTMVSGEFVDVYTLSSVAVGTKMLIQNKSSATILVQNVASQPSNSDWNGFAIKAYEVWTVESGSVGCWVKGNGALAVESY